MEKALVVEGARIQLPVLLDHLRGDAGQYTHHVAKVLKIGNHELELLIDKNAAWPSSNHTFLFNAQSVRRLQQPGCRPECGWNLVAGSPVT